MQQVNFLLLNLILYHRLWLVKSTYCVLYEEFGDPVLYRWG